MTVETPDKCTKLANYWPDIMLILNNFNITCSTGQKEAFYLFNKQDILYEFKAIKKKFMI